KNSVGGEFIGSSQRAFNQVAHYGVLEFADQRKGLWRAQRKQLVERAFASSQRSLACCNLGRVLRRLAHVIEHCCLQAAEAEVEGVAAGLPRTEFHGSCRVGCSSSQSVKNRTARITEAQQLGHFVVGFSGCIVTRLTDSAIDEFAALVIVRTALLLDF